MWLTCRSGQSCLDSRAAANGFNLYSRVTWERRQALSCQQTRELIHGYLDGELDLVKSIEIEKHLGDCEPCTQAYKGMRRLQSIVSDNALRFEPPASLEKHLRSALRRESKAKPKSPTLRWRWILAGASV